MNKMINFILFFFMIATFGCNQNPEPIAFGHDNCHYCQMMITESKYGSELITSKGKIYKFDSIECLIAFWQQDAKLEESTTVVPDFLEKEKFIDAKKAIYLVSEQLKSPMSLNISAFSSIEELDKIRSQYNGKVYNWKEVVEYVTSEWKL